MVRLGVAGILLLAVFIQVTAESQIVRASFVSQNGSGMVRSPTSRVLVQPLSSRVLIEKYKAMKKTGFKAEEKPYNSSSYGVLNPSGPDPDHDSINRAKEATNASGTNLANSTSYNSKPYNSSSYGVLNSSGPDPDYDSINRAKEATNAFGTNLPNSTSYNSKLHNSSSYGILNPGGPDPDHDNFNRLNANGATSGNPLRQLELVLYIWLILLDICIWYLFG